MSKSVLVIDTPESCYECKFNYDCCGCMITGESFWDINFNSDTQILKNCPLSPLPPHKDLECMQRGNAKSLTHAMLSMYDAGYNKCLEDLQKGEVNAK